MEIGSLINNSFNSQQDASPWILSKSISKKNKTKIQLLQKYPYYDYYLDEIMPTSLKQLYTQDKLAFPITPSMLRRTRPIIGNNQRLHMYLDKLHRKQCTTVVFMGGSVTRGEKLDIIYYGI